MHHPYERIQKMLDTTIPDRQAWIQTCETEHFPPIVLGEIEKRLIVHSKDDIPRVLSTLYHLRKEGISSIWDEIDIEVEVLAKRQCGTIFPKESIEAGKNLELNFEYLACFTAHQIARLDPAQELMEEILLARSIHQTLNESAFASYFATHPVIKQPMLSQAARREHIKQALGPSMAEQLCDLGKNLGGLINLSVSSLNVAMNALDMFSRPPSPTSPHFFRDNPGHQGCEHPPGSQFDEEGRVIVSYSPKRI